MVDGVDAQLRVARLCISADNILVKNHRLSSAGLLEHMAQSIAALNAEPGQAAAAIGFIAAIAKATIARNPMVGEVILTHIEMIMTSDHSRVVQAFCTQDGASIASAQFSIFMQQKV